jgi:two-component system, LytTR family, response regulator
MLRVAIIDDEAPARANLRAALGALSTDVEVVGEAQNVEAAVELVELERPDVLLLDIWLGAGTGFDVLDGLTSAQPKVIFITAHDQYAIRAFRTGAAHYLLKPVVRADLQDALERVAASVSTTEPVQQVRRTLLGRIAIPTAEGFHFFAADEILRCESDGNYTRLHLAGGERILSSRTLKEYDELLAPHGFLRVHLSHVVNLAHVRTYLHRDGGVLQMVAGAEVPVSQRRRQVVLEALGRRPGTTGPTSA